MGYRVVQWATGAMGKAVLRTIIDHPGVELAGVYVYSDAKAGRDAGELAGRPATGVLATSDADEILALDADVVVHAGRIGPYGSHDEELARILESGKNVITINGYSHPAYWPAARSERLRAACATGGSTLLGAGLNPGFIAEQIATVATGVCASVDHIQITESADASEVRDPAYLFGTLGFGADPAAYDPNDPQWGPAVSLNGMYAETLAAVACRLGMDLDRVETDHLLYPATRDIELPAGLVRAGTVSHLNWRWHGIAGGRRRLTMSIHWYVETAHLDDPRPPLWAVEVTGHPGITIAVTLAKHPDDKSRMSAEQYAVAGQVINAIPSVVAAAPGLLTRPIATPARDDYRTFTPAVSQDPELIICGGHDVQAQVLFDAEQPEEGAVGRAEQRRQQWRGGPAVLPPWPARSATDPSTRSPAFTRYHGPATRPLPPPVGASSETWPPTGGHRRRDRHGLAARRPRRRHRADRRWIGRLRRLGRPSG